jgi:hypothetical protein
MKPDKKKIARYFGSIGGLAARKKTPEERRQRALKGWQTRGSGRGN